MVKGTFRGLAPVVRFDVSPPLRTIKIIPPGPGQLRENENRDIVPFKIRFAPEWDPVVQPRLGGGEAPGPKVAGPIVSFDGQPNSAGVAPPDPNGAVGPSHVVAMANLSFQIFDKTGASLFGPAANNTLWTGFGGPCEAENSGDPVVLYDKLSDRWFLSQFTSAGPTYFFCVAVSTTPDPTGSYYRYAISTGSNFPDYPKASVWPDAYYVSTREFAGASFAGVGAYALNRAQAVAGNPSAQIISFLAPPGSTPYNLGDGLLPSDLDGPNLPPPGSPNYYMGSMDNGGPYGAPQDALTLWKFTADFATPSNSSFVLANTIPVASFNSILGLCGGTRSCIPQPGTTNKLDHQGYRQRPLFRLAYRNFGTYESLVTNQSVSGGTGPSGEVSGIRWWEVRSPGSMPFIYQESTFAPGITDGIHRWMGSVAMDGEGNMAMGYSASSSSVFPSVYYTGRFASSPLGTMPLGEAAIVDGTGAQTGGGNRWGDYTSLSVDPTDDLTFWHVNEYVPTTSVSGWRLRIGSFKISNVPTNLIVKGGSSIVSAGPNGALDPNETVTVALGIQNVGGPGTICTSSNLTGTLQPGSGVVSPSSPQNYGVVCSNGPVVYRNFTFTVDPSLACGSTVTTALKMTDGATSYGTLSFTFKTGVTTSMGVQNFDSVVAPALPAGWTATASGSGVAPTTVTTFPDTAPNAVYLSEQASVGLSEVSSAPVFIPSAGTQLSFQNEFNTEGTYDGLVLEISIPGVAGGAFQDILTAGGSFATGGYNSTLNTGFSNPLPGRMAWSGLSGGTTAAPAYIATVVNLPAAAVGQNVQFKWRQGSDSSVTPIGAIGSRIDTIALVSTACGTTSPAVTSAVSRKTHTGVGNFDVPLPLVPVNGAVGIEPRIQPTAGAHTMVVTFANPVTVTNTALSTGVGSATATTAGNVVTITLTGVSDAQRIGVTLSGVSDGTNAGNVLIPMGMLYGDTTGSGAVDSADVSQTKAYSGGTASPSTFRTDVNIDGGTNAPDVSAVKSRSGRVLPP